MTKMDEVPQLDASAQKEIEAIANEIVDTEFESLWTQVQSEATKLSQKEIATEFFYQGILAILTIQKLEEKEIEEEEARRFQNE